MGKMSDLIIKLCRLKPLIVESGAKKKVLGNSTREYTQDGIS